MKVSEAVTLREITTEDGARLSALMKNIYPKVYEHLWRDGGVSYLNNVYGEKNLARELAQPASLYSFIEYYSDTVGILRILDQETLIDMKDQSACKLQRIYLSEEVQGKGIGKQLVYWTKERARQLESSVLWLEVMNTQNKAIGFYQKLGFQICGKFKFQAELMHKGYRGMYRMYSSV